jgi:diguanylate cyclase (GGDEF)-like protein
MSVGEGRVIWLKDQATVETFDPDKVSISLGCLTDISKEMEVEEELKRTQKDLQTANQTLRRLAALDGLTQIANRRRFDEQMNLEWRRMSREKSALSLIMCDIDHFKLYNDAYGHQMGDDCLRAVAQAIGNSLRRPADLVARYGGEEFGVILPATDAEGALRVARDIQKRIEELGVAHKTSPVAPHVTLSLGLATMVPRTDLPPEQLVESADRALYQAKAQGRNRIVVGRTP